MKRLTLACMIIVLIFSGLVFGDQIITNPPTGKSEKDPVFEEWVGVPDFDTDLSKMPSSGWQAFVHPIPWVRHSKFHSAYYKGSFDWDGKGVIKIRLGAVNHKAKVWINGKLAGTHFGGYLPFSFDLTALAKTGKNDVVLGATDFSACFKPGVYSDKLSKDDYPKNSLIYPIGSTVAVCGLILPASIIRLPDSFIDNVWIKTSVANKKIALRADLLAPHTERQNGCKVSAWVEYLDGMPAQNIGETVLDITKDGGKAEFEADWANPKLWSPDNPNLYRCVVVLSKNGKDIHRVEKVFGFREFESRMGDFFLNGNKIILRATSKHYGNEPKQPLPADYAKLVISQAKALNSNCLRLHANPYPEEFLDEADRQGILIVNESAAWCFGQPYDIESDIFWNNLKRMWNEHIMRDYNHPSWVIASVENELLLTGGANKKNVKGKFVQMGKYVREMSGRPIMFEGDDDPEGSADIPNLHYPWEPTAHITYPQDAYFLSEPFETDIYPFTKYRWNRGKPLYMGEFLWIPDTTNTASVTEGDIAYQDIPAYRYRQKERLFSQYVQAFREQGVDAFCPWNPLEDWKPIVPDQIVPMAVRDVYTPMRFFVREKDDHFYGGTDIQRTVTVQNFSESARNLTLTSSFEGRNEKWTLPYKPSESGARTITLSLPKVSSKKTVSWKLALLDGDKETYSQTIVFSVYPKKWSVPKFTLYGSQNVFDSFKTAGLDCVLATKASDLKTNPVVIAPDALKAGEFDLLVSKGIKPVVLFPQKAGVMPSLGYKTRISYRSDKILELDFTTITWTRKTKSYQPDNVLRYFTGDNIISVGGFEMKPGLAAVPIAQAGTSKGPLVTAFEYMGKAVLTSIVVSEKILSEPRCAEILGELVDATQTPRGGKTVLTHSEDSRTFVENLGFATGKTPGISYLANKDAQLANMADLKKSFATKGSFTILDRISDTKKLHEILTGFDPTIVLGLGNARVEKGLILDRPDFFNGLSRGDIVMSTSYQYSWREGVTTPFTIKEAIVTKANSFKYIANKSMVLFTNKAGASLLLNLIEWDRKTCIPLMVLFANLGVSAINGNILEVSGWKTDGKVSDDGSILSFLSNGKATGKVTLDKATTATLVFTAYQQKAGNEDAMAVVAVNGKEVTKQKVPNTYPKTFSLKVSLAKGENTISFAFANDYYKHPQDRNLYVGECFIRF